MEEVKKNTTPSCQITVFIFLREMLVPVGKARHQRSPWLSSANRAATKPGKKPNRVVGLEGNPAEQMLQQQHVNGGGNGCFSTTPATGEERKTQPCPQGHLDAHRATSVPPTALPGAPSAHPPHIRDLTVAPPAATVSTL